MLFKVIKKLANEDLDGLNLGNLVSYLGGGPIRSDLLARSGDGYYRLLVWLSNQFRNEIIFDVGTFHGVSAVALSANATNVVISYDLRETLNLDSKPANVEFKVGKVFEDERLLKAALIFLDTNHDGSFEREFIAFLRKNAYEGYLVLDDIHVDSKMEQMWGEIDEEKLDVTSLGHKTGTGIVRFV